MVLTFNGKTGLGNACPVCGEAAAVRKGRYGGWLYIGCQHLNVDSGSSAMGSDEAEEVLSFVRAWNVEGVSHNGWPIAR